MTVHLEYLNVIVPLNKNFSQDTRSSNDVTAYQVWSWKAEQL